MIRQVTCVNKARTNKDLKRISHIGGPWGMITEEEAIWQIRNGIQTYYVKVGMNDITIIVAAHKGQVYLRSERDGIIANNLLGLPEYS